MATGEQVVEATRLETRGGPTGWGTAWGYSLVGAATETP